MKHFLKQSFIVLAFLTSFISAKSQTCFLSADFYIPVSGYSQTDTRVKLTLNQNYSLVSLATCLCQTDYYTWTILPVYGGSVYNSCMINNQNYNAQFGIEAYPATIKFLVPGTYTVILDLYTTSSSIAYICGGQSSSKTKTAYVEVDYPMPVASFKTNGNNVSNISIAANTMVNFAETSTGFATSWLWSVTPSTGWSFASGNATSQSPTINFSTSGQYSVSLKATNPKGSNTIVKSNHVNVLALPPVANFNANSVAGNNVVVVQNSNVNLNDQSENNPTSWLWSVAPSAGFSYVSGSASSANPIVKFSSVGNYSITLKASNSGYTNSLTKSNYITVIPISPVTASTISYCKGAVASALSATGQNLKWYTSETGTNYATTAPTPSTTQSGRSYYYVTQTISGLESQRKQIEVIVNELPSAPDVNAVVKYCPTAPTQALTASGANLKWYTNAINGSGTTMAPVPSSAVLGVTNYYVSQTNSNGCESNRAAIAVQINATIDSPIVLSPLQYCLNATAPPLSAIGLDLKWYSTSTGGVGSTTAPTPATNVAGVKNYYVTQNSVGCPESQRATIKVVVSANYLPPGPTVTSPIQYVQGDTALALSASGINLTWFNSPSGGIGTSTSPVPSTSSTGNQYYYVSQMVNGCVSERSTIQINVTAPAPPPNWAWGKILAQSDYGSGFVQNEIELDSAGTLFTIIKNNNQDYLIEKLNNAGKLDTIFTIKRTSGFVRAGDIHIDKAGNIFVVGTIMGTYTFGNTSISSISSTNYDFFVAKYNASGTLQWIKKGTTTYGNTFYPCGISSDKLGNIYVGGSFTGASSLGFPSATATFETSSFSTTIHCPFVCKYNTAGVLQWVKKESNITTASFMKTFEVDSLGNSYYAANNEWSIGYNAFISKFNSLGTQRWVKTPMEGKYINGIAIDRYGSLVFTGNIGTGRIDSNGNVLWTKLFLSSNTSGTGVSVDAFSNYYVTGSFTGVEILGRYTLTSSGISNTYKQDIFVAKYSSSGSLLWVTVPKKNVFNDKSRCIKTDNNGNCYISADLSLTTGPSWDPNNKMFFGKDTLDIFQYSTSIQNIEYYIIAKLSASAPYGITFFPENGPIGTQLTISGYQLSSIDTIYFNNIPTTNFSILSAEKIIVNVPTGAITGKIKLIGKNGADSSLKCFSVYTTPLEQAPDWIWAKPSDIQGLFISQEQDYIEKSITSDKFGNTYISAYFVRSRLVSDMALDSLNPNSTDDQPRRYLAKYDTRGNLKWLKKVTDWVPNSSSQGKFDNKSKIVLDKQGNIYLTDIFYGNQQRIYNGTTPINIADSNNTDVNQTGVFLIKYDTSGNFKWVKNIAFGTSSTQWPLTIATDTSDNIIVTGFFVGNTVIGGVSFPESLSGGFITKYNSNGTPVWTKNCQKPLAMNVDPQNNINVLLGFTDVFYYGSTFNIFYSNFTLAKINTSGDATFTQLSNSGAVINPVKITFDKMGNKWIYGTYGDRSDVYNSPLAFYRTLDLGNKHFGPYGKKDIFLAKYNSNNELLWTSVAGGIENEMAADMFTDSSGNAYITGSFQDSMMIEGNKFVGAGLKEIFIAKYDQSGRLMWFKTISDTLDDLIHGLGVDRFSNIYLTGSIGSNAIFQPLQLFTEEYYGKSFFAKLGSTSNTSSTGVVSPCNGGCTSICSNITGNVYQWQCDNGSSGFFNVINDNFHSGANESCLQLQNPPNEWHNYKYRCLVDNIYSNEIELTFASEWKGSINNAWENSYNWSCTGTVPDSSTDVIIQTGNPVLSTNATIKSIHISAPGNLTILPGKTLTIKETNSSGCDAPLSLNATNIAARSVYISWTPVIGALSYEVQYKLNSSSEWINSASSPTIGRLLSELAVSSTYDYRIRAICGNSTNNPFSIAQFKTATYINFPTVTIGTQIWSSKNLDTSTYRNGDVIPQVTDPTVWRNLTTGAWCWYNNDSAAYSATYGRLYNWYAVNDPRGLAPEGWHVPTDAEWNKMTRYLDASVDTTCECYSGSTIGTQLKNTTGWNNSGNGTNSSGFTGLPGGYTSGFGRDVGNRGWWWCASEYGTTDAWLRNLFYDYNSYVGRSYTDKSIGFSVRVVRD